MVDLKLNATFGACLGNACFKQAKILHKFHMWKFYELKYGNLTCGWEKEVNFDKDMAVTLPLTKRQSRHSKHVNDFYILRNQWSSDCEHFKSQKN